MSKSFLFNPSMYVANFQTCLFNDHIKKLKNKQTIKICWITIKSVLGDPDTVYHTGGSGSVPISPLFHSISSVNERRSLVKQIYCNLIIYTSEIKT